jgi:hypothetical protein
VLVGVFWPDIPEARARHALSQALWYLRRSLPDEDLLQADVETLCIPPRAPIWVDVAAFEALVAPHLDPAPPSETAVADLSQAVGLYRAEGRRLRELYHQALERLMHLEKRAGHYKQALKHALALTAADPFYEAAHREVMQLYVALGRPQAALAQFDTCRRVLESELGFDPDPATVALAHEVVRRAGTDATPHLPRIAPPARPFLSSGMHNVQLPLVGRNAERDQLLTHVEAIFKTHQAGAGISRGKPVAPRGGVVLVEGEAGVGKTRLAQEVARDAEWRGALVLWGQVKEREAVPPFDPLVQAVQDGLSRLRATQLALVVEGVWLRVLSQVIPSLIDWLPDLMPPTALEPERERLIEALTCCLAGWSQVTPLVLVLEHLHWADAGTLDALGGLARRLRDKSVLIIGNYRDADARMQPQVWEKLRALDRAGLCQRLRLSRLDGPATGELIRRALGLTQPAPLFEERLYRETGGNPLFVLETLRALCEEGILFKNEAGYWSTLFDESTWDYAELSLAPGIERVIAQRVTLLPPRMRRVLQAAAMLGSDFNGTTLAECLPQAAGEVLAMLNTLVRWRFLIETPSNYQFSHDKVRQVVYDETPVDERLQLCRLMAPEATTVDQITIRLPRADAGRRGPLRADQMTTVTWTVSAPQDETIISKKARRQHRLRRLLREAQEQGAVSTVNALVDALDVSENTIRRDLAALRRAGYDVPTRGRRT